MANFLAIIDPDPQRRERFMSLAGPQLAFCEGLARDQLSCGDFVLAWAAASTAPICRHADDSGAAVVFGQMLDSQDGHPISAQTFLTMTSEDAPSAMKRGFDGFHCALSCHRLGGFNALCDLFGLFPIYYWQIGEVILIASSPELFAQHPLFSKKLDPSGLVGLLLTNGLLGGRTLWAGVKRLQPRRALCRDASGKVREVTCGEPVLSSRFFDLPYEDHATCLDQAATEMIKRLTRPGGPCALLLSGGLDSRTTGGYMHRLGIETHALTLGRESDFEVRFAREVARELGCRHLVAEVDLGRFMQFSELEVRWCHLANGMVTPQDWGMIPLLSPLAPLCLSGLVLGGIFAGVPLSYGYNPRTHQIDFDTFMASMGNYALAPVVLRSLLRTEVFGSLVDDVLAELRREYEAFSPSELQCAHMMFLDHRLRFHSGATLWKISFGSWQADPGLSRTVAEMAINVPAASTWRRRIQNDLLMRQFPALARIGLDRSSDNTLPLIASLGRRLRHRIEKEWSRRRTGTGDPRLHGQHRYARMYDFDSPSWQALRRAVEPRRSDLADLFNRQELDRILPAADQPLRADNVFTGSSGLKLLVGFLLWSRDHL